MSKDRPVSTDALETLGTIIDETAGRDAIHIAVEPVVAGQILAPGDHIGLSDGKAYKYAEPIVGIVDPFLPMAQIHEGQWFWMLLLPRTITSLRHVWSHPFFEEQEAKKEARSQADRKAVSENWVRQYLDTHGDNPGYEALVEALRNGGKAAFNDDGSGDPSYIRIEGDYVQVNGSDAHGDIDPELWDHMEVILGIRINKRPTYFSCSC